MTIPPFPSQDLAKLVLGYLAEEQLMTAYDEFLQASPYLDALRNEYDRIFMTSLKNILAEYRAVKIYVETCKPHILRKKLVQCSNLLEVVKFLVSHIDINKIQAQDTSFEKISQVKQSISKQNVCEVCESLNLSTCACKSKHKHNVHFDSNVETSNLDSSLETTALEDLPGNHVTTRNKVSRANEKDIVSESNIQNESTKQPSNVFNSSGNGLNTVNSTHSDSQLKPCDNSAMGLNLVVKPTDTPECREKIEEFNTILKKVCNDKSSADSRHLRMSESEHAHKSVHTVSTFQDFASGVSGNENRIIPVPDSSTSENSIPQASVYKDNNASTSNISVDVTNADNEHVESQKYNYLYPRTKPKCKDQKIKIISDVKVDKPFTPINNATSTPMMQTIVINGTPAYKPKLPAEKEGFTKDEIMAMPTIIVMPATVPPPLMTQSKPIVTHRLQMVKAKDIPPGKLLSPLLIDVSSSNVTMKNITHTNQTKLDTEKTLNETGLVKTVDVTKNASVPKDNIIPGTSDINTPQVLPPVRKSSSTPRRNSHIRVLDFTTPRRILHETINEVTPSTSNEKVVDIVVSESSNLVFRETPNSVNSIVDMSSVKLHKIETCHIKNKETENIPHAINKKKDWDADLRALAVANNKCNNESAPKPKPRPRKPRKKLTDNPPDKDADKPDEIKEKKPRSKRKMSPKVKKLKKRRKLEEEEEQYEVSAASDSKITVKPTFNIVPAQPNPDDNKVNESNQNKSNKEDINETPEAERLCLQNEIGSRLNISEFLETPYKQVLYDIQMETPKFLGSVLPDEPISDIKIMNIPTPRFFDTPKPAQATPSSYSSRPTDYSSGGSYYKPDDQDYLRIPDIECPVTSSKEEPIVEESKETSFENRRSSRPVRKCAKNVSYRHSYKAKEVEDKQGCKSKDKEGKQSNKAKEKEIDDKIEIASFCSESTDANSSFEKSKEIISKTPKTKPKLNSKSDTKKKLNSVRKYKSPMKKDKSLSFMKIKPRRPTPTKESSQKRSRKKTDLFVKANLTQNEIKKKLNLKDKVTEITPLTVPAPTKSRRKSSTPRKLHCTKTFTSESSGHESPDMNASGKQIVSREQNTIASSHDSDTEHMALRWSDDGSQDVKIKDGESEDIMKIQEYIRAGASESEDISKIQEYIKTTVHNKKNDEPFHVDLIKRGFDAETAKIIERDLLDAPPCSKPTQVTVVEVTKSKKDESLHEKAIETDTSTTNELQIVQESESDDELELSAYECNEDSVNYFTFISEAKDSSKLPPTKLKDKFSMEVCIDDGVAIRLRATDYIRLFENDPENEEELGYSFRETEVAVSSISNIEKLYTPLKDHKAQCYEIFDSTLTSLDTPLKANSPKHREQRITEIEIVLDEDKVDGKDKADSKKSKRLQSNSEESLNESRKTKSEAQLLLNSTRIQDMDIESVLKKLHGPC